MWLLPKWGNQSHNTTFPIVHTEDRFPLSWFLILGNPLVSLGIQLRSRTVIVCVAAAQQFVFKERTLIKYNILLFAVANFAKVDRLKLPAPPTGFRGRQTYVW